MAIALEATAVWCRSLIINRFWNLLLYIVLAGFRIILQVIITSICLLHFDYSWSRGSFYFLAFLLNGRHRWERRWTRRSQSDGGRIAWQRIDSTSTSPRRELHRAGWMHVCQTGCLIGLPFVNQSLACPRSTRWLGSHGCRTRRLVRSQD